MAGVAFGGPKRAASSGLAGISLWLCGALAIWLGLMALRSFVAMVVWNAAEDAPAATMGLIALGVYGTGLLAWLPARFLGGPNPAWRFGLLLALLTLARQALPGELLSPALAFAAVIAWLWFLPAFLQEMARRDALGALPPALLLGLSAAVAGQTALHGIDLTLLTDPWSILGALLLVGLFLALLRHNTGAGSAPLSPGAERAAARGALLLGPYLFLQLTYLIQMGRGEMLTGWSQPALALVLQLSLLTGLLVAVWNPARYVRIILGVAGIALLLPGFNYLGLFLVQAGLGAALGAAFSPGPAPAPPSASTRRPSGRIFGLFAAGAFAFFVLLFLFYSVYGMPILWPIAAALVVLIGAIPAGGAPRARPLAPALLLVGVANLGFLGGAIPAGGPARLAGPAPRELKVLNYNIHQGFDYYSAPSLQRLAALIEAQDADLVSLQEVPRGANLSGGHDLVAWLRWRFPQYHLAYGPKAGDMFGNVVMSKYPIKSAGTERYELVSESGLTDQSSPPRGLVWATIPTQAGELLFVSTHLTAYSGYDADREAQAAALVKLWAGRPYTIIGGDFNAGPTDQAIASMVTAGLQDLPAARGFGSSATYPAIGANERIDYLFGSADLEVSAVQVLESTASDHLPIAATVRLK